MATGNPVSRNTRNTGQNAARDLAKIIIISSKICQKSSNLRKLSDTDKFRPVLLVVTGKTIFWQNFRNSSGEKKPLS
jgi:hypothetical protein